MKDETILIIILLAWLVFGLAVPLPVDESPTYYPPTNPPGKELFMKDSNGELITWEMMESGYQPEHYELRP